MKKKLVLLIMSLVFVLLIGGAYILYDSLKDDVSSNSLAQKETGAETEKNNPAANFTAYTEEGIKVNLSDYFGKPVVLNFWASWCGPCKMEMPDFEKKYLELGDEINFLMVNMTDNSKETVSGASDFIKKEGYTFPVLYDKDQDAAITYRVYSIPTTYFIDKDGNLVAQASGSIDAQTLQKGIEMIK